MWLKAGKKRWLITLTLPFSIAVYGSHGSGEEIELWPDLSTAIDQVFEETQPHRTGGVAAIIHRGEVLHLKGYGAANRELDAPWTPDTRYLIASLTKSMTASVILELQDRGLLNIDDPLSKHLPGFPRFDEEITLRHLLTMTSGLWQDEALLPLAGVGSTVSLDTLYELSRGQRRLDYPPGSDYRYTDTNYRLLARIIARVSGSDSFNEAMDRILFEPLNMRSSSAPAEYWYIEDHQVPTYLTAPGQHGPPLTLDLHLPVSGDGGVRTSMRDLVLWLQYMRDGVEKSNSRWQRLDQVQILANDEQSIYRLGVYQLVHRGLYGLSHGGVTGTGYVFFPEIDLIVAFFFNDIGRLEDRSLIAALVDAFLNSSRFDASDLHNHPDWSTAAHSNPEAPSAERMAPLLQAWSQAGDDEGVAWFVRSEEGLVLSLQPSAEGNLALSYTGFSPRPLQALADGRAGLRGWKNLAVTAAATGRAGGPAVTLQQPDWTEPRRFEAVQALTEYARPGDAFCGYYRSPALDAVWSLRYENRALTLRIGSGHGGAQTFRLTQLTPRIYQAYAANASFYDEALGLGQFTVWIHPASGGRLPSLEVMTDRARHVRFDCLSREPVEANP